MPAPPTIPGTGYVSLSDYLNANKDTLANGFNSLQNEGQGDVTGAQAPPGDAQAAAVGKAHEFGRSIGSESELAGRYGGPGGQFDAALEWAQYGPQLQSLSNYLGQQQVAEPTPAPKPRTLPGNPGEPTPPGQLHPNTTPSRNYGPFWRKGGH